MTGRMTSLRDNMLAPNSPPATPAPDPCDLFSSGIMKAYRALWRRISKAERAAQSHYASRDGERRVATRATLRGNARRLCR
jgi:hypothetical protein